MDADTIIWTATICALVLAFLAFHLVRERGQRRLKAERDQELISRHGAAFGHLVAGKQLAEGMSEQMVRDALGEPLLVLARVFKGCHLRVLRHPHPERDFFQLDVLLEQGVVVGWEETPAAI